MNNTNKPKGNNNINNNNSNNSNSKPNNNRRRNHRPRKSNNNNNNNNKKNVANLPPVQGQLLILHGSRQTGQLLLGRLSKLTKQLRTQFGIECIAPDGPFDVILESNNDNNDDDDDDDDGNNIDIDNNNNHDKLLKCWWNLERNNDNNKTKNTENNTVSYKGVLESMIQLQTNYNHVIGIMGFSQGARLVHLLVRQNVINSIFTNLKFVIIASGYQKSYPIELQHLNLQQEVLSIPSLHIWGKVDKLITPSDSQALMKEYENAQCLIHDGGHHVPTKAVHVQQYCDFIQQVLILFKEQKVQEEVAPKLIADATGANHNQKQVNDDDNNKQQQQQQQQSSSSKEQPQPTNQKTTSSTHPSRSTKLIFEPPNEECAMLQQDEVEAMMAMFPDEFKLLSKKKANNEEYEFPISYNILLQPDDDIISKNNNDVATQWPKHLITLHVTYPSTYPTDDIPTIKLQDENNVMEFPSSRRQKLEQCLIDTAQLELGMSSMLSCIYAAREFLDSPPPTGEETLKVGSNNQNSTTSKTNQETIQKIQDPTDVSPNPLSLLDSLTPEQIQECNVQGLKIAHSILQSMSSSSSLSSNATASSSNNSSTLAAATTSSSNIRSSGGGLWTYTIGLVGKPSAGKSTVFNVASAFARQRGEAKKNDSNNNNNNNNNSNSTPSKNKDNTDKMALLGGASMAPHPFTTIDPNIGFCLVPAPFGSCPEDDVNTENNKDDDNVFASTHGRTPDGRRLLPVLLKDVAGLVPGAYQGRGRGNQFLNDLCDANVLVHVVDASGTADAQGNSTILDNDDDYKNINDDDDYDDTTNNDNTNQLQQPLEDLAWIRNELVEWICTNLSVKWDSVKRKGRSKLEGMFSGYGQTQAQTIKILSAVEKHFMENNNNNNGPLSMDDIESWNSGHVHTLVSAFVGVRFPMALALNKCDIPSSKRHVDAIQKALPIHGAYVGTPMMAKNEMMFVKQHILQQSTTTTKQEQSKNNNNNNNNNIITAPTPPLGVWQCLQSAMMLRQPVLVFPVMDFVHYTPMPGLNKRAIGDPSLPSLGMICCLQAAGGNAPTYWDPNQQIYNITTTTTTTKKSNNKLRDVLIMKPNSTVEDVFIALKRLGGLSGEFVRAEGACYIGDKPKPIPKYDLVGKHNRILKIMSNKRSSWQ